MEDEIKEQSDYSPEAEAEAASFSLSLSLSVVDDDDELCPCSSTTGGMGGIAVGGASTSPAG